MDLRSGQSYWPLKNGLLATYPTLANDERCEIAVIGGGITGALVAYYLSEAGVDVVAVEKRDVGMGSTAASTGLLMYEIDTELVDLIKRVGEEHAVRSYRAGLEAVQEIGRLVHALGDACGYQEQETLYFASKKAGVEKLHQEFLCRQHFGFDVRYLEAPAIRSQFALDVSAAILSRGDARVDPYRLTHRLLAAAAHKGARVYDRTTVTRLQQRRGGVVLETEGGSRVQAKRVVFATGYETQAYLRQRVERLHSSYVVISEPIADRGGLPENCLIWETARPYFYLRGTEDGRIIIGGQDTPYGTDHARDRMIKGRVRALERRLQRMVPALRWQRAYAWAGTFGESKNGLPYVGETPECPHAYFALAYGGNGITFGAIGARIITDLYLGRPNADAALFGFDR